MNRPRGLEAIHLKELLLDNRYFIYLTYFLKTNGLECYRLPDTEFPLFNSRTSGKQSLIIY